MNSTAQPSDTPLDMVPLGSVSGVLSIFTEDTNAASTVNAARRIAQTMARNFGLSLDETATFLLDCGIEGPER